MSDQTLDAFLTEFASCDVKNAEAGDTIIQFSDLNTMIFVGEENSMLVQDAVIVAGPMLAKLKKLSCQG